MTEPNNNNLDNPDNQMSGIYAMLLEVLQSIANAPDLQSLLTGAFVRLRWVVNMDYCSTSFHCKETGGMKHGVIVANGVVDKTWQWEVNEALEQQLAIADQSKSKLAVESRDKETNQFNIVFDRHPELEHLLCFRLPVVGTESAFVIIATRQPAFDPQALNILNVFIEFLSVNIVKQRYTEDLDHALSTLESAQEQLIESEKMRALGSLVAGIAHEINTPLGVAITAFSHLSDSMKEFQEEYDNDCLKRKTIEKFFSRMNNSSAILTRNLHRATDLIHDFKQVAADQSSEKKRQFELKSYIDEVINSLTPQLKKGRHTISVETEQEINLDSYPGAIAQVMTNLIVNSVLHGFKDITQGSIHIALSLKDEFVYLDYQDSGRGLTEKQRERVFEPFYTTARFTGGTGLGMSISYNLITSTLGGEIHCLEAEQGAHFTISFPVIPQENNQKL